ncbi:disease resistance protein RPV1-like [Prosopis cineraria]|uniref:disease resistance protein RPV1-like n=1 Tax=Prosopis cineraria TaxID=364024 RepID=UPI00240FCA09|nr:disease resistance protein RPV1-like [Prosopis cineraria]
MKIAEFDSFVAKGSEKVQFIGICGMGGLGKTTLAKVVYEKIHKDFEVHCFLHNVRELAAKDGGLILLQRKLLSHCHSKKTISIEVGDHDEGRKLIKRLLCNTRVLLVLDDVSDKSHLENLAGNQEWFGQGSKIIITTRDHRLLSLHYDRVSQHKVKFLSHAESSQLFLQTAFKGEQPSQDYLELSKTVIKSTKGLPLALKVFGSFLCGRTILEWKDALRKVPPNDILKILKVSFDGLEYNEKTIFLDIACFFNGMAKDDVIEILKNCDLYPTIGIAVLIEKSLVTEDEGRLRVHDMLQEMGKEIVFCESPNDVGKRSRIWSLEDANHVLKNKKSLECLKFIDLSHSTYLMRTPNFDETPNLQRLILEGCTKLVQVHHSLGQHKNIVFINLKGCKSIKTLPKKCEMNCLETFILSGCSKVKKLPEFGEGMERLSRLDLEETAISVLPQSLINLIGLTILNLRNCKNLVCLPCDFQKLKSIKIVNTFGCSKLSKLPKNLNENEALEELDLSGTAIKEVPPSLNNLKVLSLSRLKGYEQSKSSSWNCCSLLRFQRPLSSTKLLWSPPLSNLSYSLVQLHLAYCNLHDASLSNEISRLPSLTTLDLCGNNFVDFPSDLICNLGKLECITLNDCPKLQSLPRLPSSLSTILASDCLSIKHYVCSQQLWEFIESFQSQCDFFLQPTRMLTVPGSEVPSWFHNQHYFCQEDFPFDNSVTNVSFIINMPDSYYSSEWWGIAVCLVLENDLESANLDDDDDSSDDAIWWTYRFPNGKYSKSYRGCGIYLQSKCCHQLCIIYICCSSFFVDQLQLVFFTNNKGQKKSVLRIGKCGWRVLCKEDVERWQNTGDEGNSVSNNDQFIVEEDESTSDIEPSSY